MRRIVFNILNRKEKNDKFRSRQPTYPPTPTLEHAPLRAYFVNGIAGSRKEIVKYEKYLYKRNSFKLTKSFFLEFPKK